MKANITFSNGQKVEVSGVESLSHAERVALVLAVRFSSSLGIPLEVLSVYINERNFSALPCFEYIMEGVEVVSSIGG